MKHETVKFGDGLYVNIPKGTFLTVANPEWDGDIPETQYDINVVLLETMTVCIDHDKYEGLVLKKLSPQG